MLLCLKLRLMNCELKKLNLAIFKKLENNVLTAVVGLINTALREGVQHHTKYYDEFVTLLGMEGYKKHDQNTIHLPRQEFRFCLNLLVLCGFSHRRKVHYNDFTTFEKCSDMTNIEKIST